MTQGCSCHDGADTELTLDNGRVVHVAGMSRTFLEFQALGMPANAMVGDMPDSRIRARETLTIQDKPLFKAALLREYVRYCAAQAQSNAIEAEAKGQATPAVEIFSKPTCPYTRALRRKLEHDRVVYVEYDVEAAPVQLRRMLELNGGRRSVPTVRTGDDVVVGFHGT